MLECEKSFLESFGYTVLTAASGGKGLELASTHSIDVVIVDYLMPQMNGHEVAMEIRRLNPQAPIIMLSAAVDVPEQALSLVDAFISKDSLASQLLPAIAQLHGCRSTLSYDAMTALESFMTILLFAGLLLIARCISIRVASADGPRPHKNGQNQIALRYHKTVERS